VGVKQDQLVDDALGDLEQLRGGDGDDAGGARPVHEQRDLTKKRVGTELSDDDGLGADLPLHAHRAAGDDKHALADLALGDDGGARRCLPGFELGHEDREDLWAQPQAKRISVVTRSEP